MILPADCPALPSADQILFNGPPNDRKADSEVFMCHNISHSAHFQSGQFRMFFLDLQRDVPGRFPDDLQIADHCIHGPSILNKLLVAHSLRVFPDLFDAGQDVFNSHSPITFRRHRQPPLIFRPASPGARHLSLPNPPVCRLTLPNIASSG